MRSITIITPSLNRAGFIEEAIQSVLNQDYPSIEHIIVDGGSTDMTMEILSHYPHLKVISEPDNGIYNALNKGIKMATGEIIGLLNTDDYYEPNVFNKIVDVFQLNTNLEAMVGGIDIFAVDKNKKNKIILSFPTIQNNRFWNRITIGSSNTNAWFFQRRLFERVGFFNEHYKYSSDREFFLRLGINSIQYYPLENILYHYRLHDHSITLDGRFDAEAPYIFEWRSIIEEYLEKSELPATTRGYLVSWYGDILSGQVNAALKRSDILRAIQYARTGISMSYYWPYFYLRRTSSALIKRLNKFVRSI